MVKMIQRQLEAAKVQQQQIPQEKSIDKPADNTVPSNTKSSSAKKVEE